jgi:hypothetical protein
LWPEITLDLPLELLGRSEFAHRAPLSPFGEERPAGRR